MSTSMFMTSIVITDRLMRRGSPVRMEEYYARTRTPLTLEEVSPFLKHISFEGRVLEIGAGTAQFAEACARERPDLHVEALDIEPASMELIRDNHNITKHLNDYHAFRPNGCYNGIAAKSSLYFTERDALPETLRHMRGWLSPKGILYATFMLDHPNNSPPSPNAWSPRFSESEVRTLFENAGFKIIHYKPFWKTPVLFPREKILNCVIIGEKQG